jgi:hypothetical protein
LVSVVAATTWDGGGLKKIDGRLNVGRLLKGILPNCARIVSRGIPFAGLANVKHCCIGLMIVGRFD